MSTKRWVLSIGVMALPGSELSPVWLAQLALMAFEGRAVLGQPCRGAVVHCLQQPMPHRRHCHLIQLSETGQVVLRRAQPSCKPKYCQTLCNSSL